MASQSASDDASGFSTSTATPARAAAMVGAACSGCGVQTSSAGLFRRARADRDEFGFGQTLERRGVQVPDFSATDQGCSQFTH
jgi:hypothetical protein